MSKKFMKIIFAVLMLIMLLNNEIVSAESVAVPGGGGGGDGGGGGGGHPTSAGTTCGVCKKSSEWLLTSQIEADVYNTDGEMIGSAISGVNTKFTAGRFVGLDVYEKYKHKITVNVESVCVTITLTCNCITGYYCKPYTNCYCGKKDPDTGHRAWIPCQTDYNNPIYTSKTQTKGTCEALDSKCSYKSYTSSEKADPGSRDTCLSSSSPANVEFEKIDPSFEATYYNSNDINKPKETQDNGGTYTIINNDKIQINSYYTQPDPFIEVTGPNTGKVSREFIYEIKYNLHNACVNTKTGLISYRSDGCNDEEIEAHVLSEKGNDSIGKYFIPLNAKTTNTFSFELNPNNRNGALRKSEICIAFIKKYPHWRNFIRDRNGLSFMGVSEKNAINKIKQDKYCKYGITGTFNIEQEFYNETTKNKLEGYGVFFRPIDINNPFPNGLNEKSYWYNFYDLDTKKIINLKDALGNNIDIANSFNNSELNYKIYLTNNKIEDIKEFDLNANLSDKMYTSWKSMNKNGISNFITESRFDILKRISKGNKYSFYKLGCGPLNASWEECK